MKKLGILSLVVVLGLGLLGISYGAWTSDLHINGTATTGTLEAAWVSVDAWDDEPDDKDYSSIQATIENDTILVTIENAYPCIGYYLNVTIENTGDIPLHLWDIEIDLNDMNDENNDNNNDVNNNDNNDVNNNDNNEDMNNEVNAEHFMVHLLDEDMQETDLEEPIQIHPGETYTAVIRAKVAQSAPQGAEFEFSATVRVIQWNMENDVEPPAPPEPPDEPPPPPPPNDNDNNDVISPPNNNNNNNNNEC